MVLKKIFYVFIIMLLTIMLMISGCNSKKETSQSKDINFSSVQYNTLPPEVKSQVEKMKTTENYTAYKFDNKIYLVAIWGQKNTGGYTIKITRVTEGEDGLEAVVEYKEPGKNEAVVQVITYPLSIVEISPTDKEKIIFKDTDNNILTTSEIKEINKEETVSINIFYPDKKGEVVEEAQSFPAKIESLPPQEQAEMLLKGMAKKVDYLEFENISYNDNNRKLSIEVSEKIINLEEEAVKSVADSIFLTLSYIMETSGIELKIVEDDGTLIKEYNKYYK